jgi:uncharacterized membrane protein YphA (DoxX/SURF4 family)
VDDELSEDDVEVFILPLVLLVAEVVFVEVVESGAKTRYAAAPATTTMIITTAAIIAPAKPRLLL